MDDYPNINVDHVKCNVPKWIDLEPFKFVLTLKTRDICNTYTIPHNACDV